MTSPKPSSNPELRTTPLTWSSTTNVTQVLADEAIVQFAADRVYLSFGQVQMPPTSAFANVETVAVEPVARLVLTAASFHKLVGMLNQVAAQIAKAEGSKGEVR